MLQLGPPPSLHFLPPALQFILIMQRKLSRMEWLPAVAHKPLIVLWSWIVAFYQPVMVKGTFATGVGHGIFSGSPNRFQGLSFFILHLRFHLCVQNSNLHLPSSTMSYSPYNPIQFLNMWMNIILLYNHLSH